MEKHDGPEWAVAFGSHDDEMIVKDVLKLGDGLLLDEETASIRHTHRRRPLRWR